MAYIISIDASTKGCSAALFNKNELVGFRENLEEKSAASFLVVYIQELIAKAGITFKDLAAVAVCKGPGSYTGLRVAVSTAKGLAMALDVPLMAFESLELLSSQVKETEVDFLCPMIDARRLEVFTQVTKADGLELVWQTAALIVNENTFDEILEKGSCYFYGDGSAKFKDIITHKNAIFKEHNLTTHAQFSGDLVWEKYQQESFEDLLTFEPFYLKEYMFKVKG